MILYLALAVVASALMALGLLMMKTRSAHLPMASGANVIGAIAAWIRDPMWIGGLGVQTVGWACYVIAVSRAPVSMVAVMGQGGIALFVVASVVILGERASPREWVGIAAIMLGMLMLTLSLNGGEVDGAFEPGTLLILTALLTVAALAPMAVARLNALLERPEMREPCRERALALQMAGYFALNRADTATARCRLCESLGWAEEAGPGMLRPITLQMLGEVEHLDGALEAARRRPCARAAPARARCRSPGSETRRRRSRRSRR